MFQLDLSINIYIDSAVDIQCFLAEQVKFYN